MNPDQQIELYRAARSIAWSYRLQDYNAAALKDLQRIVDKSKASIVQKFADGLGQEGPYTRKHFQNNLKELERLSLGLRNQLGEQLTTSTSRIGSLALKEWGENLSVGGVAKKVNTVALSPEQFAAFFKRNPPAGILIPKVMRNALNQGVTARIEGELLDVLREGALTGQSYKRIVDKLEESFTDFNRHQLTTLTRTFFQTANAQAFDAVYQANQDIMEGKIWTNVNDDRVCLLCLPLGEVLYKKGDPHPPMPRHPNCRCVFRAKTVSYRSLGIDVDELEEVAAPVVTRGYEKNGKWIIPPAGTGTGRRPRAVSFYQGGMKEAFPNLPEAQQKAMLGVGRYNLYKAGDLSIDQLVDPVSGKLWLLKELDEGLHLTASIPSSINYLDILDKFDTGWEGHHDIIDFFGGELGRDLPKSVEAYTGSGYRKINKALREVKELSAMEDSIATNIQELDEIISKNVIPENLIVRRGMGFSEEKWEEVKDNFIPGTVFMDEGFVSTTVNKIDRTFLSGDKKIQMNIKLKKGALALYMPRYYQGRPEDEMELLLGRGSKFKVISMVDDGNTVMMEVELL